MLHKVDKFLIFKVGKSNAWIASSSPCHRCMEKFKSFR
jgi:hypothetical protein